MVVLLPKAVVPSEQIERMLTAEKLSQLQKGLSAARESNKLTYTDFSFPKLKIEATLKSLGDTLKDGLGLRTAFDPNSANFSSLTPVGQFALSKAIQKTYLVVNELGTVAAAVTLIGASVASVPPKPLIFHVDHPYSFVIQHAKSGLVLFQGTVNLPEGGDGA